VPTTTILAIDDDHDDADVARMLRAAADRREAELDAISFDVSEDWISGGRSYVRNLRDAANYHERQALKRQHLNGAA
jgi:hypothetical protein